MQWLTYALWGWTLLSLTWLISVSLYGITEKSAGAGAESIAPYAIASVAILLPASVVCDILFTRKETAKKTGFQLVIMVIHAVIFALFGIGALIVAVFTLIQSHLAIDQESTPGLTAITLSAAIMAALYAATLVRTLRPGNKRLLSVIYTAIMTVVSIGFIVLAITGPIAIAQRASNDRFIDQNLPTVKMTIDNYVATNKKLPTSLSQVTFTDDAKKLIDKNIVTYSADGTQNGTSASVVYRYQLCTTYVAADEGYSSQPYDDNGDGYSSYLDTGGHASGKVCYKLSTEVFTLEPSVYGKPAPATNDSVRSN